MAPKYWVWGKDWDLNLTNKLQSHSLIRGELKHAAREENCWGIRGKLSTLCKKPKTEWAAVS